MKHFCSVCGGLWDRHPAWTLVQCVKVIERRSDDRAAVKRYFVPQGAETYREDHLRRALEYRRGQKTVADKKEVRIFNGGDDA
jgi:hypothetical protein